jgi:hypothetical protein
VVFSSISLVLVVAAYFVVEMEDLMACHCTALNIWPLGVFIAHFIWLPVFTVLVGISLLVSHSAMT